MFHPECTIPSTSVFRARIPVIVDILQHVADLPPGRLSKQVRSRSYELRASDVPVDGILRCALPELLRKGREDDIV